MWGYTTNPCSVLPPLVVHCHHIVEYCPHPCPVLLPCWVLPPSMWGITTILVQYCHHLLCIVTTLLSIAIIMVGYRHHPVGYCSHPCCVFHHFVTSPPPQRVAQVLPPPQTY
ncbi:hypothetical protein CDAR_111331 [Caerostris darwini]|uniref:Uncharacterized protein n=1 Tax=Caerostris darwini TaxID=1538125 RepID=A0AAV4UBR0_9ARAC|nr:hypothetical protein CDAR_111331 [Caerostris darwini]